jgi:biopolymer transport protein ExbD
MARSKRATPEVNAGSMADIAFLLLIFFLVTTTMDVDSGLTRMLPPPVNSPQDQNNDVKERNVFVVLVNKDNRLLVEGEPMNVLQLKEKTKEFIANPKNADNLPEKKETEIQFFGMYPVSKQIISLQNDRGTSYGTYIEVQNELVAAYNELRDELSLEKFGKKFNDLNNEQADAIKEVYPQRISEAEPKNIGGAQ